MASSSRSTISQKVIVQPKALQNRMIHKYRMTHDWRTACWRMGLLNNKGSALMSNVYECQHEACQVDISHRHFDPVEIERSTSSLIIKIALPNNFATYENKLLANRELNNYRQRYANFKITRWVLNLNSLANTQPSQTSWWVFTLNLQGRPQSSESYSQIIDKTHAKDLVIFSKRNVIIDGVFWTDHGCNVIRQEALQHVAVTDSGITSPFRNPAQ